MHNRVKRRRAIEKDVGGVPDRYIIASSPSTQQVVYTSYPGGDGGTKSLIETGLVRPQEIALIGDDLYVCDAGWLGENNAAYVARYKIRPIGSIGLQAKFDWKVAESFGGECAGLTSSTSTGEVFFSVPSSKKVYKVVEGHPLKPWEIYDGVYIQELGQDSTGLFSDNFSLFLGTYVPVGTSPPAGAGITKLAQTPPQYDKASGMVAPGLKQLVGLVDGGAKHICAAGESLYYTNWQRGFLRATKTSLPSDSAQVVDANVVNAAGCTWDRDGSVLLGTQDGVYVYSGALNSQAHGSVVGGAASKRLVLAVAGAYGVQVFVPPPPARTESCWFWC